MRCGPGERGELTEACWSQVSERRCEETLLVCRCCGDTLWAWPLTQPAQDAAERPISSQTPGGMRRCMNVLYKIMLVCVSLCEAGTYLCVCGFNSWWQSRGNMVSEVRG